MRRFEDLSASRSGSSAPAPLVLLDEEQQRALRAAPAAIATATARTSSGAPRQSSARLGSLSSRSSSFPPTPTSDHSFRRPEPRTDFTSGGGGYHYGAAAGGGGGGGGGGGYGYGLARAASPRTNFTSGANRAALDTTKTSSATWKSGEATQRTTINSSPRTNFTTRGGGHSAFSDEAAGAAGSSPVILQGDDYPSEYAPLRRSNPFLTIEERDSTDAVEAFKGTRSTLRLSVTYILIGAVIGLGLGIMLATLKVSDLAASWVSLPGDLFLRAVKSLVVPYVFCSVAVAVGDIVYVGKVSAVGLQTLKIFLTESFTGSAAGLAIALAFRPLFREDATSSTTSLSDNAIAFQCPNGNPLYMQSNGTLSCSVEDSSAAASNSTGFVIDDVYDTFTKSTDSSLTDYTITDQLTTVFDSIVPSNVFSSMSGTTELLSVITFAMVMGAIAGRNYFTRTRRINYLYMVLLQLRNTFFLALEWVIWLTPVAVVSIIAGSFASNQSSVNQLADVYMFLVASLCGLLVQMLIIFPAVMFFYTRCNPYQHMKLMARSYIFAFGSASSLATAPVTLGCIQKARVCSQSLANFVISIGVVTNMSGAGFYYPIGIVFLAESSGAGAELTALRIFAIYCLTIIACSATPPVPSSGVVVMATMYKTVFGVSELPSTWALFVAMDFFADRLSTVCNVNDDIMALKVIAENTDETVAADHLGRRE